MSADSITVSPGSSLEDGPSVPALGVSVLKQQKTSLELHFEASIKIWREFKLAKKKEPYNFVHVLYTIVHETKIFVHLRQGRKIEIKIRAQI